MTRWPPSTSGAAARERRVLGGVGHEVRGGSRRGSSGRGGASGARQRGPWPRRASRLAPGRSGRPRRGPARRLGRPHGGPLRPAGPAPGLDEQAHASSPRAFRHCRLCRARHGRGSASFVFQLLRHETGVGATVSGVLKGRGRATPPARAAPAPRTQRASSDSARESAWRPSARTSLPRVRWCCRPRSRDPPRRRAPPPPRRRICIFTCEITRLARRRHEDASASALHSAADEHEVLRVGSRPARSCRPLQQYSLTKCAGPPPLSERARGEAQPALDLHCARITAKAARAISPRHSSRVPSGLSSALRIRPVQDEVAVRRRHVLLPADAASRAGPPDLQRTGRPQLASFRRSRADRRGERHERGEPRRGDRRERVGE